MYQQLLQIAIAIVIIFPPTYWFFIRSISISEPDYVVKPDFSKKVSVILPMRNEAKNVVRKISSIVEEISEYGNSELIVIDSASSDGSGKTAEKFLRESKIDNGRWRIITMDLPGKCKAINQALKTIDSEILVISDADAKISPGWLEIILIRLSNPEIGVVSGMEDSKSTGWSFFNKFYRESSNFLRIIESKIDSTVVIEGSLIAVKKDVYESFKLDEGTNGDDAQFCFEGLKRGFRTIVDPAITFDGFEMVDRRFRDSVRRSQGLTLALISNIWMCLRSPRKKVRVPILNSIILYVLYPWLFLCFVVNSSVAFIVEPKVVFEWQVISIFSIIFTILFPQGRSLAFGCIISITAHLQLLFGKKYSSWDPNR